MSAAYVTLTLPLNNAWRETSFRVGFYKAPSNLLYQASSRHFELLPVVAFKSIPDWNLFLNKTLRTEVETVYL